MNNFAIQTNNLKKLFGEIVAVNDLNLEIPYGQTYGLLGPNGAGKTTTVRILNAIISPTSGNASVGGYNVINQTKKVKMNCGFLPESPGLYQKLTATEFLEFIGELYYLPKDMISSRIDELLDIFAMGTTTIAPVAKDEVRAMGRTNNSIIYSGKVYLTVEIPEEEEPQMVDLLNQSPSSVSPSYGKPFYEMLKEVDFDFYKIDGKLFAPAIITINNLETGKLFTAGNVNEEVLWSSYFN